MHKIINSACVVGLCAVLASCVTTQQTAKTADFPAETHSATIADLKIAEKRISHTIVPSPELRRAGEKNVKNAVMHEALEIAEKKDNKSYDVIVNPEFVIEKTNNFFSRKISKISVTGRPASYTNFRSLNDSVWSNPVFRGAKVVYVSTNAAGEAKAAKKYKVKPMSSASGSYRPKGYFGTLELAIGSQTQKFFNGNDAVMFEDNTNSHFCPVFTTVHGYRFSPRFSIGLGVGFKYWRADLKEKYLYGNERIEEKESGFAVPAFFEARYNFRGEKQNTFFASFRLGCELDAEGFACMEARGAYVAPSIGYSHAISDKHALELALQYQYSKRAYDQDDKKYYNSTGVDNMSLNSWSLRFGYTF